MNLVINANSWFSTHYLKVKDSEVHFCIGSFKSPQKFGFGEIDCILLSAENQLSFRARGGVYRIPMDPSKPEHAQTVAALLEQVEQTDRGAEMMQPAGP